VLLRSLLGDALRRVRLGQQRTLRDVSADARVSLGYLSEIERGQKEASSELLSSICDALGVKLSQVLRAVSDDMSAIETGADAGPEAAAVGSGLTGHDAHLVALPAPDSAHDVVAAA